MGQWLESHAWLAAWLALPVAIVVGILQGVKTKFERIDWRRSLIYIAFLTSLAVAFTPRFDETARAFARAIVGIGFGFLLLYRPPRQR